MQTILKVVRGNRGQASIIDKYLDQFCVRAANEALSIESPSSNDDNVAFARDDLSEVQDTVDVIAAIAVARQARASHGEADQELLPVLANRLSMIVHGGGRTCAPLSLHFILTDPAIALLRIELTNPLDKGARTAPCVKAAPEVFIAAVEPKVVERWYNANRYWKRETKKLPVRVLFTVGAHAGCRTIWVAVSPIKLERSGLPDDLDFAWFVEGPCSRPLHTPESMPGRTGTES
jgi:hypothetical protein